MPVTFDNFWTAVETLVKNTWSDVTQCWRTTQFDFVNLRREINNSKITLPIAIIEENEIVPHSDYGVHNEVYKTQVNIYYVTSRSITTAQYAAGTLPDDLVRTKCKTLADAMYAYSTEFQVVIDPSISVSDKNRLNRAFGKLEFNLFGGLVSFEAIVGEY